MKSILDRSFRYTSSVETDLRKTFARIRREQRAQQQSRVQADAEALSKVHLLRRLLERFPRVRGSLEIGGQGRN